LCAPSQHGAHRLEPLRQADSHQQGGLTASHGDATPNPE
jgi:hypothetical protein